MNFGPYIRQVREELGGAFSLRQVAERIGIAATYLSKIEREELPPPSEDVIVRLAAELGEDPNVLLAMAGKVSERLKQIICKRPKLFAQLLEQLETDSDQTLEDLVARKVRDGKW